MASAGVLISRRIGSAVSAPMIAVASESRTMKTALLPTTRLAWTRSRAPTLCPTMMPVAMTTPNTAAISRNSTMLALVAAVSGASPRK